jgi:pullulanase
MDSMERDFYAYLDELDIVTVLIPFSNQRSSSVSFYLKDDLSGQLSQLDIIEQIPLKDAMKYICRLNEGIEIGKQYWVTDKHGQKTDMQIGAVIRTREFDERFFYDGPLGISYSKEKTEFRLWAPSASDVRLMLIAPDGHHEHAKEHPLTRKDKGVWTIQIIGDLECFRYYYLVCVNRQWKEAVDPYASAVSVNGEYGMVIDMKKTRQPKPPLPPLDLPADAIIYETHIRDLTVHPNSGIVKKGTYLGAAELNTMNGKGMATGLSYMKELGVTHIEFLPVHDFAGVDEHDVSREYNWGYNPLHFNAPDGSYSSDPANPYARIKELKSLIRTIHSQGLRVIMDVVYNHVYIRESSSFEKIVPGYFFRHDSYGMPSNGTGVGNDFASERLMARKFIIDSCLFWLKEYQIDGFRFDLMGILDVTTMNQIRKAVHSIDPDVLMIGEGWDLNTPIPQHQKANIRNQEKLPGIGQFNDWFRDTIKGNTFNLYDRGYALGNEYYYQAAKEVLAGSIGIEKKEKGLFDSPLQSVNYVESHDNHTLWDKLSVCSKDLTEEIRMKQHRLATVMVLLAQGIPFLHSGQEFFRTKQGIGNSYRSSDEINQLNWDRKNKYIKNVQYIHGMIRIRKSHKAFRLTKAEFIRSHMKFLPLEAPVIGFTLSDVGAYGKWDRIMVILNPSFEQKTCEIEGIWEVLADENRSGTVPIRSAQGPIKLMPISSYVFVQ